MNYINPILLEILKKRGISGDEQIREFLSDKPQTTYDPFLLPDLEAGVEFLLKAVSDKKNVCIYGDYDADGITSVSILMEFLGTLTKRLRYYIPSRFDEGYGLNIQAVKKIKENGVDVLVTVDCGSVSYDEVEYAKELGMEVLVTDHHSITDTRADCLLINPKRPDSHYPFKELAGCGVAFKLIQGIQKKAEIQKSILNRSLDLVALGTIADVVPLLDENRTLVKHGMHIIGSGLRPGLAALIEGICFHRETIRADQIAFGIAPHLNAAGRMGDAKVAAKLMLEQDRESIPGQVSRLVDYNKKRKKMQEEAYQLCVNIIDKEFAGRNFPIVYAGDVHEGIAGIVAGKLKDKYGRPTILVTPSGDDLKGTGRSIAGVNLYDILKTHEKLFLRFGGHEGACGFLMKKDNLETLSRLLEADMEKRIAENPKLFSEHITADLCLEGSQVSIELAQELELLGPFGCKNPRPLFSLQGVHIIRPRPMGEDGRHIRFFAVCQDQHEVECVLFHRAKDFQDMIYGGNPVELTGSVEFQEWRGNKKVQFNVETMI